MRRLFVALVTLTILSAAVEVLSQQQCSNAFPGADLMVLGIDPTVFDVYSPTLAFSPYPILNLTCGEAHTWTNPADGTVYDVPDQLLAPQVEQGGVVGQIEGVFNTTSDLQAFLQTSVSVESSSFLGLVSSSATNTMANAIQMFFTEESAATVAYANVHAWNVATADPVWSGQKPELSSLAKAFIANQLAPNPTFSSETVSAYEQFFSNFGTHYVSSASFGGRATTFYYTQDQYLYAFGQRNVSLNAEAGFLSMVSAAGGFSGSTSSSGSAFLDVTENSTVWNGPYAPGAGGWVAWSKAIQQQPTLLKLSAYNISSLIDDAQLSGQMNVAILNHMAVAYVAKNLIPSLSQVVSVINGIQVPSQCNVLPSCGSCCGSSTQDSFNQLLQTVTAKKVQMLNSLQQLLSQCQSAVNSKIVSPDQAVAWTAEAAGYLLIGQAQRVTTQCSVQRVYNCVCTSDDDIIGHRSSCGPCCGPATTLTGPSITFPQGFV